MVNRTLAEHIRKMSTLFPVVSVTGARQCGKSTLLKMVFPDYRYVSLEDTDIRRMAIDDPRGFLSNFGRRLIIDEAQYSPVLFSYIQTKVDEINDVGMYILSGSQNFLMMERISQSLAGRVAVVQLSPFSVCELEESGLMNESTNSWLFNGGYPRIYDKGIPATVYYSNYVSTYLDRDVRTLRNVGDIMQFNKFLRLCAGRIGQVLNIAALANDCDISVPTVKAWLSILETSYIVFQLQPYFKNYNKRLIKSPKLYFHDTGLASYLLGVTDFEQLSTHYMKGHLFENMVVSEFRKSYTNAGKEPQIWYWRESNGDEVDLITGFDTDIVAYEIKSSETINRGFYDELIKFSKFANLGIDRTAVIYGGNIDYSTEYGTFKSYKNISLRLGK